MTEKIKPEKTHSKAEQLPLIFAHQAASGRDDLLVSASLEAAVKIVDEWPNWPSSVVVLTGVPGSGKSHLANIWKGISGAKAIRSDSSATAARLAETGPVLFEDADRDGFDDTELFHVINSLRQHDNSMLITSRLWPASWPVALPDLRSRLKAVTVVEIGEPDEGLLTKILIKLFADRQLYMDDKLIAYIVNRMERSLYTAQTIVDRLDRMALARATRITRPLAAEVLNIIGDGLEDD